MSGLAWLVSFANNIDIDSLERYLNQTVPVVKSPIQLTQAGNMILKALPKTDVPVPKAFCLCEDSTVIGTSFYIKRFLDGRHYIGPAVPNPNVEERKALWEDAVRTLAKLYRVVPSFYDRQLNILTSVSMAQSQVVDGGTGNAIRELPYLDKMVHFFSNRPLSHENGALYILGLEMVTLGHLLSDLCNLKSPYSLELVDYKCVLFHPDIVPGLPTRDGCIGRYKEDAGEYAKDLKPFAAQARRRVNQARGKVSQKGKL
ncbi:hypothetical protein BDV23DRAFT_175703 [Aspergillus alliaceus]|uniref:Aminoglycoside phosphotransferase domain-containing protein n=1 Tax=Petromyces alliaceus TaxID=209559 RepID=A0A5N7BWA5_PETAA|nr:hypothetical protein BDV23DRAFT_175703 [Aspergillus alliaceus]